MNTNITNNDNGVAFEDLDAGCAFELNEDVFIKLHKLHHSKGVVGSVNAINLRTGTGYLVEDCEQCVIPLECFGFQRVVS